MNNFLAVLKDSYREARDGFIVYVMLGFILLLFLLTASLSFEPAPAATAFEAAVKRFEVVFPDRGQSKIFVDSRGAKYSVSDVREIARGQYEFELKVEGLTGNALTAVLSMLKGKEENVDGFRLSVVNWLKPAGTTRQHRHKPGMPPLEVAEAQPSTPEEQKAVTDEQLAEFLRHQFHLHAGIDDVQIQRIAGVKEPDYRFAVTAKTGSGVRGWPHATRLFFGSVTLLEEAPLGMVLWIIEDQIINGVGASLALLISTIITASFIPNMLRKGSLDLLITKPISRVALLIYKYIGGLTFIFLISTITIGGMWIILGWRTGYWDPRLLLLIPIITFTFAILYAVSTLFGVLTRNAIVAIIITIGFSFVLYVVGNLKTTVDDRMADPVHAADMPSWVPTTMNIVHGILPRYKDLDRLTTKLIAESTLTPLEEFALAKSKAGYPEWSSTIGVSVAFIVVMLGLACWRFTTRDG